MNTVHASSHPDKLVLDVMVNRMNKSVVIAILSALAATSAFAKNDYRAEPLEPVEYHYGMNLDVKRVISLTDTSDSTGVVPATLIYENSQGQVKSIEFTEAGRLGSEG